MRILLVAATLPEIFPIINALSASEIEPNLYRVQVQSHEIDFLLAGTSSVPFIYSLCKYLTTNPKPDLAILAGIAGTFNYGIRIGTVVEITSEIFGDTGAEDRDGSWISMFDLGLWKPDQKPFQDGKLINPQPICKDLLHVSSVTVSTVSGSLERINYLKKLYHPDIENMEGAAFFYWCSMENIPFAQIRSISNRVEPRNREAWDIRLAVTKLNDYLYQLLMNEI